MNRRLWRISFALFSLLIVSLALLVTPELKYAVNFEDFQSLPEDQQKRLESFKNQFESTSEAEILVLKSGRDWLSEDGLNLIREIDSVLIEELPSHEFHSLNSIRLPIKKNTGINDLHLLSELIAKGSDIHKLYEDVLEKFISKNGQYTLFFVPKSELNTEDIDKLKKSIHQIDPSLEVNIYAKSQFIAELNEKVNLEIIMVGVSVVGLLIIALYALIRTLKPILFISCILLVSLSGLVLLMFLLHVKISPHTVALPGLVAILSFSDAIHIYWFQRKKQTSHNSLMVPLILTSLTNCLGFSFFIVFSENPGLLKLGVLAILSVVFSLVVSLWFLKCDIEVADNQKKSQVERLSEHLYPSKNTAGFKIVIMFILLGATYVLTDLKIEDVKMKSQSEQGVSSDILQQHFFGAHNLEVSIALNGEVSFTDTEVMKELNRLEYQISELFPVAYISSPNQVIRRYNRFVHRNRVGSFCIPEHFSNTRLVEFNSLKSEAGWFEVVSNSGDEGKLSVGFFALPLEERIAAYEQVEQFKSEIVQVQVLSKGCFNDKVEFEFVKIVLLGFAAAYILTSLFMGFLFRSIRKAVLFFLTNVIPMVVAISLLVLMDVSINSSSLFLLSILLGVSMDDSIYFMFQKHLKLENYQLRIPILLTSIVLTFGVLGFIVSSFEWIRPMSLILAFSFLLSLLLDIKLLSEDFVEE